MPAAGGRAALERVMAILRANRWQRENRANCSGWAGVGQCCPVSFRSFRYFPRIQEGEVARLAPSTKLAADPTGERCEAFFPEVQLDFVVYY